jgi:hypothetical protein
MEYAMIALMTEWMCFQTTLGEVLNDASVAGGDVQGLSTAVAVQSR